MSKVVSVIPAWERRYSQMESWPASSASFPMDNCLTKRAKSAINAGPIATWTVIRWPA